MFLFIPETKTIMKKIYPLLLIPAIPVILILLSNSTGSPGGKSGSIGDNGNTCIQCHTPGPANTVTGWITTNVPAEGYTPGQTYLITATGTHNGVVKFGFELTVEDSQGNKVGTLQLTEPTRTKFTNSNHAVTHTAAGNVPSGNTNTWTMNWVAPSNVQGNIGIYAAFNAANGNGNNQGDVIYKSSIFISKYVPPPTLVSIVPNQGEQGQTVQTTITGSNTQFAGNPSVSLSFSNNPNEIIAGTNVVVISPTVIHANFAIPLSASTGLWDVHVNLLVLDNGFTVTAAPATILTVMPNSAYQGESVAATVMGSSTNWSGTPSVQLKNTNNQDEIVQGSNIIVVSPTELTVEFSIPSNATTGLWDLHVDDLTLASSFTVDLATAINDNKDPATFAVYPNPASDHFFIENAPGTEIEILRTSGELVSRVRITENRQMIDVSRLSKGIYIIGIRENGTLKVEKLLVN